MKVERTAWLGRYTMTFRFDTDAPHDGLRCEWSPTRPEPSTLTRAERRAYLRARRKFLVHVAKNLDGLIAALDL